MKAAIQKGAHPSARAPEAAAACRTETLEKVEQGFAKLVKWSDMQANPPTNLKMSPLAAIPHKSRLHRMMLDLSYNTQVHNVKHQSVNEATTPTAPKQAMDKLGTVTP